MGVYGWMFSLNLVVESRAGYHHRRGGGGVGCHVAGSLHDMRHAMRWTRCRDTEVKARARCYFALLDSLPV